MSIFTSMDISGSGLTAERLRMNVVSDNIANMDTLITPQGGPYQRQEVIFTTANIDQPNIPGNPEMQSEGVQVAGIVQDPTAGKVVYDPQNPAANAQGYVTYPNVNIVTEMTDMMAATRSYQANVTAFNMSKTMAQDALQIGKA